MTSNKHKKATPRKSPQKPSSHRPNKSRKSHQSPLEKVVSSKVQTPTFSQNSTGAAQPILPFTKRLLFSESANSEPQPFSTPIKKEKHFNQSREQHLSSPVIKREFQNTRKHALSPAASKISDDPLFKKQRLSSPAKQETVGAQHHKVDARPGMKTESEDEDEDEDEYNTPSPESRKRKPSAKSAFENYDNTPLSVAAPPTADVAIIPTKRGPSSSFSFTHPNPAAIAQVDIAVMRLKKEELRRKLDASQQEAQEAKANAEKWAAQLKATADESHKMQLELKQRRQTSSELLNQERLQFRNRFTQMEREISTLKAQASQAQEKRSRTAHLAATNQLLAKQVAQLTEKVHQEHDQAEQISRLKWHVLRKTLSLARMHQDLDFKDELAAQGVRTHEHETSILRQRIAHLQGVVEEQRRVANGAPHLIKEIHDLRDRVMDQNDEIGSLKAEHAKAVAGLRREVCALRVMNGQKDVGLERMGRLVGGWALKWQAVEGKVPGVEGVEVRVDGEMM